MEKYVISLDWLELHCRCHVKELLVGVEHYDEDFLTLEREEVGTKFFRFVYVVKYKGNRVASMVVAPRASFINERVALLKIDNYVLYTCKWFDVLEYIRETLGLELRGITRLDVCYDCIRFAGGRKPHKFIRDYISYLPDERGFIHRFGSNKFSLEGDRKKGVGSRLSYIRFGARSSCVQCYMYNKSKELREVKEKPYIREMWKKAGLNEAKEDVWRTEISIKSQGLKVVDINTGELFSILPDDIMREYGIEKIFYSYARKYLNFAVNNGNKLPKDYERLTLFEKGANPPLRPRSIKRFLDTGRSERVVVNKLIDWSENYIDLSGQMVHSIKETIAFFLKISCSKEIDYDLMKRDPALRRFSASKFLPEYLEEYRELPDDSRRVRLEKRKRAGLLRETEKKRLEKISRYLAGKCDKINQSSI